MKNKKIILIVAMVVVVFLLVILCFLNKKQSYEIETIIDNTCKDMAKEYYIDNDITIYSYCLDSIKIEVDNEKYELKDYLSSHSEGLSYLINKLEYIETYKDGGTKLYRDNQKISNQGLTVITCNSMIDVDKINNDIYIGPKSMSYEDYFCK